jgi:hypothetical protein
MLWCICSVNANLRILRLFTAGFSKFHSYESCIQWHQPFHNVVWIHLEWILKHHWFIASRTMGTQIFQKSESHLKILGTSSMIWSQFSYWQSTYMLQYKMLPSQSCAWYLCICALEGARVCVHMHTVPSLSESCSQTLCLSVCQYSKIFLNQVSLK